MNKKAKNEKLPLRRQLGIELVQTYYGLYERSQLFFAGYGLTSQQYNILKILHEEKKTLSTSAILERLVEKNAGVSRLIDRLVAKDLVIKEVNFRDRRLADVLLTEQGTILYRKVTKSLHKVDQIYDSLTDEEIRVMLQLLSKLKNSA